MLRQELPQSYQRQSAAQEMISGCAHELRTPLTSLRALVDTLIDGAIDDPAAALPPVHGSRGRCHDSDHPRSVGFGAF